MRCNVPFALAVLCVAGCSDASKPAADRQPGPAADQSRQAAVLKKPIGIKTAGDVFTPLLEAGQRLPSTRSETFTNKTGGGREVLVTLVQTDASGIETIASLIIAIPPKPDSTLHITVTLKISEDMQMRVKTTVSETASVQEFGPFPVE